jgi:hypothetical protein
MKNRSKNRPFYGLTAPVTIRALFVSGVPNLFAAVKFKLRRASLVGRSRALGVGRSVPQAIKSGRLLSFWTTTIGLVGKMLGEVPQRSSE